MGDVVLEWVTPYILTQKRRLIKAITLSAAVVFTIDAILFMPIFWFIVIPIWHVEFFVFRNWKYEYEYVYVNGDFEISKIIRKCKRKLAFHGDRKDMEYIVKGRQEETGMTAVDYMSGVPGAPVYTMKINGQLIYFEPTQEFIDEMKNYHKVRF